MAASDDDSEPDTKRPCSPVLVKLEPLKSVGSLRERYSEDTADVFFVEKETKERVPAHREVLKVASPVFFNMFDGDWKEKKKKEVPAPEEYNWESFKAAIALLYGEEVKVEESSIPDIYRVAHLYDLRGVISVLAHAVCQWDRDLLETVVELCVLTLDMPDRSEGLLNAAVPYIAHHLEEVKISDFVRLSYEVMQMLVQCEDITSNEIVLLRILHQWTNEHLDITVNQLKQLYSHIRFGTIPYESLAECSMIGHDKLKLALENHQKLSVDRLRSNLHQVTPRSGQKEVFQVYPMVQGVRAVVQQNREILVHLPPQRSASSAGAGILYCGKQVVRFKMDLKWEASMDTTQYFKSTLFSVQSTCSDNKECALQYVLEHADRSKTTLNFLRCTVVLDPTGAYLTLQSTDLPGRYDKPCAAQNMDLPFKGSLPWVLTFDVSTRYSNTPLFVLTIHPPIL